MLSRLQRLLNERRIFIPYTAAGFAAVQSATVIWVLRDYDGIVFFAFVVLASLGVGWLFAIYMWHLTDALRRMRQPWVSDKSKRDG